MHTKNEPFAHQEQMSEERDQERYKLLKPGAALKHGERFSFGARNSLAAKVNSNSFVHENRLLINEEAAVYVPNSRQ